ncbi:MAG: DUF6273 domain-containing protein [Propionibacteriaceae bacterium]|jgi:hypothetical protein|nr:DUF6273 domain-containing protein [Propionibacteriaceae bacterium]
MMTDNERHLREAEARVNVEGGPVWVALDVDVEHKRALFIARDIVAEEPYHKRLTSITWEDCSLRKWLNTEFLDSLPEQVKSRVVEVTNQNPSNKEYKTAGGNATKDQVFLLSIDEVKKYFDDDDSRTARFNGTTGWWWLRSPGSTRLSAAGVIAYGYVSTYGYLVFHTAGGVRPAVWLSLGE